MMNEKKESYDYIKGANYIFNAKLLARILSNCNALKNKITKVQVNYQLTPRCNLANWNLKIINELKYNGHDLCGQDFDINDVFLRPATKNMKINQNIQQKDKKFFERRISIQMKPMQQQKDEDLIEIDLPIYDTNIEDHFMDFDLSINCVYISLLTLKQVIDTFAVRKNDKFEINDDICNRLRAKVKGVPFYDIKKDIKNRVITTNIEAVIAHLPMTHFWRVVKFAVRYFGDGWVIDPKLIKIHKDFYKEWIDDDDFMNEEVNQKQFVIENFEYGHAAKTKDEYVSMMKVFDILGFKAKLLGALNRKVAFKKAWIEGLNEKSNDIVAVFQQTGYPIKM